jgi:hypothetical protein
MNVFDTCLILANRARLCTQCRLHEAIYLMESLVRENPAAFLTERVALNLWYVVGWSVLSDGVMQRCVMTVRPVRISHHASRNPLQHSVRTAM